jgi:hypothetical protein
MEITACKNRDKTGKSMEVRNDEHGDGSSGAEEENGRRLFSGRKDFSGKGSNQNAKHASSCKEDSPASITK